MKVETYQLHGNNSMCAGTFQLLRGRAPAQLRGNIDSIFCVTGKAYIRKAGIMISTGLRFTFLRLTNQNYEIICPDLTLESVLSFCFVLLYL
jgi:hypothetical protein